MRSIEVIENLSGFGYSVLIVESDTFSRNIDLGAISWWQEMLGLEDPAEALEAICHVYDNKTEPPHDPVTRENVWSAPMAVVAAREQAREAEYIRAIDEEGETDDPRSPHLRASLAAHNAVHTPLSDGVSLIDHARDRAREKMNIPRPRGKMYSSSRWTGTKFYEQEPGSLKEVFTEVLEQHANKIEAYRRIEMHDMANAPTNVIEDEVEDNATLGNKGYVISAEMVRERVDRELKNKSVPGQPANQR